MMGVPESESVMETTAEGLIQSDIFRKVADSQAKYTDRHVVS
jgi:hypothetical protein